MFLMSSQKLINYVNSNHSSRKCSDRSDRQSTSLIMMALRYLRLELIFDIEESVWDRLLWPAGSSAKFVIPLSHIRTQWSKSLGILNDDQSKINTLHICPIIYERITERNKSRLFRSVITQIQSKDGFLTTGFELSMILFWGVPRNTRLAKLLFLK